jgi:DNA replication protein DnaC
MTRRRKPPTSRITEEIRQLLHNLHLRRIEELYDEELHRAEQGGSTFNELFVRLLRAQYHHRQESALTWRIRRAGMPEQWTLESFPFKLQPGVSQKQIRSFAELDFVPRAENIILIGSTGVGKTGLATGLLLKALENGYRGLFVKAQDLFDEMYASLADRSSRRLLRSLARVSVLVIDEMGYLNLRPEQTNIFFRLMEERYKRVPTIITTNLDYEEWANFLGHKELTKALLSRLRQYCHTVRIDGPSLRDPQR